MKTTTRIKLALQKATSGRDTKTIAIVNENCFKVLYKTSLTECIHGDIRDEYITVFNANICKDMYETRLKELLPEFDILMVS